MGFGPWGSSSSRLPILNVPDTIRNDAIALLGEFVGTFLFLFFSFAGTQISNTPKPPDGANPNTSNLVFASLAFGISLLVNVWAFYRITGGLFNPSVSLALVLVGGITVLRGTLMFAAQIIAGIAAAGVVSALFPSPLNVGTRLGGGASISQGLFIEMFLTAQLVFVIHMVAVTKHKSTYLAPIAIGMTFFLCEIVGIYFTGGSLNPARSLGPDVVNRDFPGYHWIYWLGPLLGTLLATGFYGILKTLRYETCNPGQDSDGTSLVTDIQDPGLSNGQKGIGGSDLEGNNNNADRHGRTASRDSGIHDDAQERTVERVV